MICKVRTFHSSLPMAETASVFGEMLLTDKLLAEENDPLVRRTLLSTILDDAYATITRQGYFVIFEKTAHKMILDGATADQLHETYLENLREQFGELVLKHKIKERTSVSKAAEQNSSVLESNDKNASKEFYDVFDELTGKIGLE